MPAKEERWCNSGSKSLDKHEPRNILHCHVERHYQSFAVAVRAKRYDQEYFSVFYRIQCFLNNFELNATITSASKTVELVHTLVRKSFPTPTVHTITPMHERSEHRDSSLKRMCCRVWRPQRRYARAQAGLAVIWHWLRIHPTTGRLARSPDSGSLLRSVWPEIRTFARPGVQRAVSSAVIIRFRGWIRRKCLSWSLNVSRGLSLRGLSFVLPICQRQITNLEIVILDTLKWSAMAWWVIPAWTKPTARSRSFWRSRGIDVHVKIQIFRMANCSTINDPRWFIFLIRSS